MTITMSLSQQLSKIIAPQASVSALVMATTRAQAVLLCVTDVAVAEGTRCNGLLVDAKRVSGTNCASS